MKQIFLCLIMVGVFLLLPFNDVWSLYFADIDQNGKVNILDSYLLIKRIGQTGCPQAADLNGDCTVNIPDLILLLQNFNTTVIIPTPTPTTSLPTPTPTPTSSIPTPTIPVSADYYVAPNGSANNAGTQASPWTLSKANQTAPSGSTVILLSGTYNETVSPQSGTAGNPTIYQAAVSKQAIINNNQAALSGKSYIVIKGIKFQSNGPKWVTASSATHHIIFDGDHFDQSWPGGYKTGDFNGFPYSGTFLTIRNSSFGWWHAGDMLGLQSASNVLIEDNDFSQAASGHIEMGTSKSNFVIRRNIFRNPWDRIGAIESAAVGNDNTLFEDNLIFDSNWDGSPLPRDASSDPGAPGANQVVKFNTGKGIFRNNLLVGNNKGLDSSTTGMIYVALDSPNPIFENSRIYHNTIHSNPRSGISIHDKINSSRDANNIFKNNIISSQGDFDFQLYGSGLPVNTYVVSSNIFANSTRMGTKIINIGGTTRTVAEAESAMPAVFRNNIASSPLFTNPGVIAQGKANPANWPAIVDYSDFVLQGGSPGKGSAEALTFITQSGSATSTIRVDDALYFSDGFGVAEGDEILVGGQKTRVVRRVDDTTLQISPAITVTINAKVYLSRFPEGSDIGVRP